MYGTRIVSTNRQYVSAGTFNWVDDQGHGVAASRSANIGDWGAHFRTSERRCLNRLSLRNLFLGWAHSQGRPISSP